MLRIVIGLCATREIPIVKLVKNVEVNHLTGVILDGRALKIDIIRDVDVRYATMGISYNVYYKNRESSCVSTGVHVTYLMVKENAEYDLCEIIWRQLLDNIEMSKSEMYLFRYGSLIVCLVFYFLNTLPRAENVAWRNDMTIGSKIKGYLDGLDDSSKMCRNFFVKLRSDLFLRNRIPPKFVDWYGNDIVFLVKIIAFWKLWF